MSSCPCCYLAVQQDRMAEPVRQDRQRHRHGDKGVDRWPRVLPAARDSLYPAHHFARGRSDPAFRTKPQLTAALAARGKEAGFGCRRWSPTAPTRSAMTGISRCGRAELAYVVALKPRNGIWAPVDQPHTPIEAVHPLAWQDAGHSGDWRPVELASTAGTVRPGGLPMTAWAATAPTQLADWSWPPPTRPRCRRKLPGTWPPTCLVPTRPTPPPTRTRRPTSRRSSASTACARGSSRATGRSRTNSAGPTSKSAPTAPSDPGQLCLPLLLGPVVRLIRPLHATASDP